MNIMRLIQCQKHLQVAPSSQGWTLIEMLMAAALTLVVTSAAAAGVITLIHSDNKERAQSKMANDVNRAVEFISEEIRPALKVESNASTALANAPDFTLPTGATPILVIERPELPQRIVYYTQASANPWLAPNVIYRWGPPMDSNGDYDSTTVNTPSSWTSQVLIDLIDNIATARGVRTSLQASNGKEVTRCLNLMTQTYVAKCSKRSNSTG